MAMLPCLPELSFNSDPPISAWLVAVAGVTGYYCSLSPEFLSSLAGNWKNTCTNAFLQSYPIPVMNTTKVTWIVVYASTITCLKYALPVSKDIVWGLLMLLGTYSCFSNWKREENIKLPQIFLMCKSDNKNYLMNECGVLLNLNTTQNFSRNLKTKQ
jgi:hypothetical protein